MKKTQAFPTDPGLTRVREAGFIEQCPKCRGTGRFTSWSGRQLGECFACKGRGQRSFKSSPDHREQARNSRAALPGRRWEAFMGKHPAEAGWIIQKAPSFEFAASLKEAVEKYGDLTDNQMAAVRKCLAKDADRSVNPAPQREERAAGIDLANLVACFQRAHEAALKRFTLRFDGVHFQADKNDPTVIWVSQAGYGTAKYGRIASGTFRPGREATPEVLARIAEIAKDPMAAALAYAQVTSSCSVCGRHLENQDSVDAGIGPICAGRLNRPGLKFERVEL